MIRQCLDVISNPFVDDPTDHLWVHWNSLRIKGPIPHRSDMRPASLATALDMTFILQDMQNGGARFRLVGRLVNELLGMDMRGMPATTLMAPSARADWTKTLDHVFRAPATLTCNLAARARYGAPALQGKMTILPLLDEAGHVTRAVGTLMVSGQIGDGPRRFDTISDVNIDRLHHPKSRLPQPLATKKPAPPMERPALFVVQ